MVQHVLVAGAIVLAGLTGATPLPARPYLGRTLRDVTEVDGAPRPVRTTVGVIVPASWRPHGSTDARLRLRDTTTPGCPVDIEVFDRVVTGSAGSARARLAAGLPARTSRHVVDSGTRRAAAWRVVRHRGADITGRYAIASDRATQAISPPGDQVVWHEVEITTTSTGECHSGTYRRVAEQIGSALASLRRSLTT